MNSISSSIPTSKSPLYYVYTLAYPESMGGIIFYVGKGKGNRIYEHEITARQATTPNSHKTNIIRKVERNGERIIRTKLAFFEDEADAFLYETALIFFMRPYGHLTNLTDGGEGASGVTHVCPEDVKRKLSALNKGKPGQIISEEGRRRLSEARKGKPPSAITLERAREAARSPQNIERLRRLGETRRNQPLSEETRNKLRQRTGWHHSEATKQRISAKNKGRPGHPHSELNKRRVSERHKGKVTSEATKQKMREASLGRVMSLESRRKMSESAKQRVQHRDASGRFKPAQPKQIIAPSLWEGYYD